MASTARLIGVRRVVLLTIGLAGIWAAWELGLRPGDLVPADGGVTLMGRFFAGAVEPAMTYEADFVPEGTQPLIWKATRAAATTVVFAAAATSISLVLGLVLGILASTSWWMDNPVDKSSTARALFRRIIAPAVYASTRVLIALARSIHELIWAVLFLCAMGLTNLAAVIAIVIPYAGTFAKIFSEIIDEAPRDTAIALRGGGASTTQVFLFGLLPRALPDLSAYAFYRFECALRSSAVLGFFGIPTLGYFIQLSFHNTHYREVWTYLYTLLILIVTMDWWSGALRRRISA